MVADFFIGMSGPFAVGLFDRFYQPGVGTKVLNSGEAIYIVDFIQDHQGQDGTDTGDRAQQVQGVVIMLAGGFFDMPL